MLIRRPMNVLAVPIDSSATAYHRIMQPAYWLQKVNPDFPVQFLSGDKEAQLKQYEWCEAIFIQCLYTPGAFKFYAEQKRQGKRIVLDFDDDYINIPDDAPDQTEVIDHETGETYQFPKELRSIYVKQFTQLADVVVVTSQALKNLYSMCNKNVTIIPNCVSEDMFRDKPKEKNDKVRILWSGSSSHLGDLELVRRPLERIVKEMGDKIELHFQGPLDFNEIFSELPIKAYPAVPYGGYLDMIQDINPDIAIAPLRDNLFNVARSEIKYLQMSIMESAFIGSSVGPYVSCIDDGYDGMLAAGEESWFSKLKKLVESEELRKTLTTNAIGNVKANFMIEKNLHRWRQLFTT